jgi:predicted acylesterase/phospholipase RssA/CRP-like cAMP-binding protein
MKAYTDTIREFGRRRVFEAGTRICDDAHRLDGAYLIESGVVGPGDHVRVDFARHGIVFEKGDLFGEYTFVKDARAFPSGLRALTRVEAIYLDRAGYERALDGNPGLGDWFEAQAQLKHQLVRVIAALRRHEPLREVPAFRIVEAAKRSRAIKLETVGQNAAGGRAPPTKSFAKGKRGARFVPPAGNLRDGVATGPLIFVARGAVKGGGEGNLLHRAVRSDLTATRKDTWIIDVPAPELDTLTFAAAAPEPRVIVFWSNNRSPELVSALTALVAEVQQGQKSLPTRWRGSLLLVDAPARLTPAQLGARRAGVTVQRTTAKGFAAALGRLEARTVYLDVSRCSRAWVEGNVAKHVWKAVFVSQPREDPPPFLQDCKIVRCTFLPKMREANFPTTVAGALRLVRATWAERFQAEEEACALLYHPKTVRLRFADPASLSGRSLGDLAPAERDSLARIARALADRRVGVALGGGAAWGYAHIALLEALAAEELPMDALSGVSFGSLVGGYYSVGHLSYARTLIAGWARTLGSMLGSAVIPPFLDWYLFANLRGRYLEDLEVPFFPVALNLQNGHEPWTPARGTVAFGVRAASSMPGFLSPALGRGIRAVDGAYVDNVPEGVLHREGVHFIIASNIIEEPGPAPEYRWWPFSWTLNPLQRAQDSARSVGWLMKAADERDQIDARIRFEPHRAGLLQGIPIWAFWKSDEINRRVKGEARRIAADAREQWLKSWA